MSGGRYTEPSLRAAEQDDSEARAYAESGGEPRDDRFREECAVVGIYGHEEAANLAYLGLYAMQHRGQEGSGIVSSNGKALISHRGLGLVADVFHENVIRRLVGSSAIGHNRYSTAGETLLRNTQPLVAEFSLGSLAVCHNGNFVNALETRRRLEENGSIFQSTSDTEVLVHLVAGSKRGALVDRVIDALGQVEGAYCVLFLTEDELIAARDPHGFRPLVLGKFPNGAWVVASETCALDLVEAEYVREIEPGEVVHLRGDEMKSIKPFHHVSTNACIFEYVYFARPDSRIFGRNVYAIRKEMGRQLARESMVEADIVIPVPDSGVPAALGFADQSGLPFEMGLIRNHYVGRTFIEPKDSIRNFGVKVKLNAQRDVLEGKRVIVIDDSIVRGTTSRKIVRMIRGAGAKEVHMRISAPPTISPCYFGVDTPTHGELIANNLDIEAIRQYIQADSLAYLSHEGLYSFLDPEERSSKGFCDACFTRSYPVQVNHDQEARQMRLFHAMEMSPVAGR
ncbi:MAG TPA: amidophosphoribosyltransferase [Candidatus Limnocylindrales bacterium]|nr:amidophosphoribosyltransferase [Candidatus Limnocylindrales bacterium]